jgi:4-hydroxy-3-polyprenylbenzoate decarboxylase
MMKRKIIVAVTGASGSLYAKLLINKLVSIKEQIDEAAIIFSGNAKDIWDYELKEKFTAVSPFKEYSPNDFHAPFASGSSTFDTMIICPCSMGTLGRIASGTSEDLILRAADVILKERRKLILVPREMPYNLIHLENMKSVTLAGGIICPASPSFYSKPETIEDLAGTIIERVLILAEFKISSYIWGK